MPPPSVLAPRGQRARCSEQRCRKQRRQPARAPTSATAHSSAQEHVIYIRRATTSYSSPTNQSTPVHDMLKAGDAVTVRCFTEGQELLGNYYWLKFGKDGQLGFVHRDTAAPGGNIPHC